MMYSKLLLVVVVVGCLRGAQGNCMVSPSTGGDQIDISVLNKWDAVMEQGGNNQPSIWEINWCKAENSVHCGSTWNAPAFVYQDGMNECNPGNWVLQKFQSGSGGDGDPIMLIYEDTYHPDGGKKGGTFSITIECDEGGAISDLKGRTDPPHIDDNWPSEPERLTLLLRGKIACKGAAADAKKKAEEIAAAANPDEGGDAGGWVFIGIVLGGLAIYFGAGFAYNYKKKELRGKEAIPHVSFWMDLPFLVKDGAQFAFTQISSGINRVRGK